MLLKRRRVLLLTPLMALMVSCGQAPEAGRQQGAPPQTVGAASSTTTTPESTTAVVVPDTTSHTEPTPTLPDVASTTTPPGPSPTSGPRDDTLTPVAPEGMLASSLDTMRKLEAASETLLLPTLLPKFVAGAQPVFTLVARADGLVASTIFPLSNPGPVYLQLLSTPAGTAPPHDGDVQDIGHRVVTFNHQHATCIYIDEYAQVQSYASWIEGTQVYELIVEPTPGCDPDAFSSRENVIAIIDSLVACRSIAGVPHCEPKT